MPHVEEAGNEHLDEAEPWNDSPRVTWPQLSGDAGLWLDEDKSIRLSFQSLIDVLHVYGPRDTALHLRIKKGGFGSWHFSYDSFRLGVELAACWPRQLKRAREWRQALKRSVYNTSKGYTNQVPDTFLLVPV